MKGSDILYAFHVGVCSWTHTHIPLYCAMCTRTYWPRDKNPGSQTCSSANQVAFVLLNTVCIAALRDAGSMDFLLFFSLSETFIQDASKQCGTHLNVVYVLVLQIIALMSGSSSSSSVYRTWICYIDK